MPKKKTGNEVAIRREASLAAAAWQKLETAAQSALNGGDAPALRLVADTAGITAHVQDEHGTSVVIQGGKISVTVRNAETEFRSVTKCQPARVLRKIEETQTSSKETTS